MGNPPNDSLERERLIEECWFRHNLLISAQEFYSEVPSDLLRKGWLIDEENKYRLSLDKLRDFNLDLQQAEPTNA
jgi:hypothetical protein